MIQWLCRSIVARGGMTGKTSDQNLATIPGRPLCLFHFVRPGQDSNLQYDVLVVEAVFYVRRQAMLPRDGSPCCLAPAGCGARLLVECLQDSCECDHTSCPRKIQIWIRLRCRTNLSCILGMGSGCGSVLRRDSQPCHALSHGQIIFRFVTSIITALQIAVGSKRYHTATGSTRPRMPQKAIQVFARVTMSMVLNNCRH
jgi:hypothetical protein